MKILPRITASIALLSITAWASEVGDARKAYREASGASGPKPHIWNKPLGTVSTVHWTTHGGKDTGALTEETRIIRQGLRDFNLNVAFLAAKTTEGYWVGSERNCYFIFTPDASGKYTRQELYGPNLKSIRATREAEKSCVDQGGDIVYITNEGIFKASELGDRESPSLLTGNIDEILVLSVIDARVHKEKNFKWDKMLPNPTVNKLKGKGYKASILLDPSLVTCITQEAVDRAEPSWIRSVGPPTAQWVLVWSVTDVSYRSVTDVSYKTAAAAAPGFSGFGGQAGLAAILFDKRKGTIAWRGFSQIDRPLTGLAANDAIEAAFQSITASFPRKTQTK